ncbi:MAG: multiheme c-type cytochrome [Candidatus Binatia bacterium]
MTSNEEKSVVPFSVFATARRALAVLILLATAREAVGDDRQAQEPGYIGSTACRSCHEPEFAAWTGSDHDLAMQGATPASVLGDFRDARFEAHGVVSTFRETGGGYFVRIDGADGKLADFEVKYVFGVRPLQQYLVEFGGGRLQALPLAWDSRTKADGGQRWFHLYPDEKIAYDDQLHWTGLYQNWNLQCASCHSTVLRKNHDGVTGRYATTWAEIDVACEGCHGPGAGHAAWAKNASPPFTEGDDMGLTVRMRGETGKAWAFSSADARYAELDPKAAAARAANREGMNVCASCHARRSALTEDVLPGAPLEDSHRLALLTEPLYFADGQQQGEVYTWGSFLQSKMYERGVTCGDCHDPHTLKVRADGNALCSTCHNAAVFDTKTHHFHEPGSKGAQCVECHMPARNYMVIDARRDHSLRVPRPDLSEALGSPDACRSCHVDRTAAWAAGAMDGWYGPRWRSRPEYGSTLRKAATEGARALAPLLALAEDRKQPAIVRATAAALAEPVVRPQALARATSLAADADALVRLAALGLLESFEAGARVSAAAPLLGDERRAVRTEAARLLADVDDAALSPAQREARAKARAEYLDALALEADGPASLTNLGNFRLREGRVAEAVAAYEKAIALDLRFAGAYVNLADARRLEGRDGEGEAVLRRGLVLLPESAALHHALGLLLVRKGDKAAGMEELAKAAKLDPGDARLAYVHAIGLKSVGRADEALAELAAADRRHPWNLDILGALVSMNIEAGRPGDALPAARRIAEVLPEDEGVRQLIARLEAR